jgi:hypothetical protein
MSANNTVTVFGNSHRFEMEGQCDISAAAAVTATRGSGATGARSAAGVYAVTITNPGELKLVTVLHASASLMDAAVGTVKDVGIVSLAQDATTGVITLTFRTVDAAGANVDEAASALTVSWSFVIQTARMTNPLD